MAQAESSRRFEESMDGNRKCDMDSYLRCASLLFLDYRFGLEAKLRFDSRAVDGRGWVGRYASQAGVAET